MSCAGISRPELRAAAVSVFDGSIHCMRRGEISGGVARCQTLLSAVRRKARGDECFVRGERFEPGHDGLGGSPESERGPRGVPFFSSRFGFIAEALRALRIAEKAGKGNG